MTIVAWPEAPYIDDPDDDWLAYERARADAAMARLKVAVEALEYARMHMAAAAKDPVVAGGIHGRVFNALHDIGPLPE